MTDLIESQLIKKIGVIFSVVATVLVLVTLVYANGEEQDVHIEVVRKMNTGMAMSSLATHGS